MKFIIESKKSKKEIVQILLENTSEHKSLIFRQYDEFFSGKILDDSFKIWRNISYQNSFLPVILGNLETTEDGCKIYIKTRMCIFVLVFLSIWFTGVIGACLIIPFCKFPMPYVFIPYIMLIFGILIVTIPNKIETKKAKEKLEELLK